MNQIENATKCLLQLHLQPTLVADNIYLFLHQQKQQWCRTICEKQHTTSNINNMPAGEERQPAL